MTNQLTLLFLVVVISGALCTVEDYVIMSQCAHNKAIYLAAEGTVSVTDISQTQNITIVGRPDFVNNNFKIALYAKETQRYLCFNDHWKLVGMKELQDTCYFNEAIVHGYFVFRSVVDQLRRIGFTQRGRAVGPKKTVNDACYMFTKIPTDQFFHQHNHFASLSAPRARATTKTPKTAEHSGGGHLGRGSGSGGGRPNRHRNQHRTEETEHGGGGRPHVKKPKVHNNGNGNGSGNSRKRQHQQRLQQMRGGHGGGHSLSGDPKNSTYLNSSRQNVELSQYGGHNHTAKHHNHSQPQYHHQTRHHHNDSRRHHHDQKQKTRTHHRARVTPSPAAASTTTTPTTTASASASEQTAATSTKPKLASSSEYADIKPTSVVQPLSTVVTATTTTTNHDVLATSVAHKRKGRRRKPHRKHTFHKSEQPHEHDERGHSEETSHGKHPHGHATLPYYDEEEYMTTDYTTWINSDMSPPMGVLASVKPTSASLPTWETWYPSSSTPMLEDSADYSSTSVASYEKDDTSSWPAPVEASSASASTSSSSLPLHYDISKNPLPLMPLPFPTFSAFSSTSHSDNSIDELITPTVMMSDLGAKTTNTSTFSETETETETWSHQHLEEDLLAKLALGFAEEVTDNSHVVGDDLENATTTTTSASDESNDSESSMEASGEAESWAGALNVTPTKSTEPQAPSTFKTPTSTTASGSKPMTDYIYATRTAPITGNHKVSRHRHADHGHHDSQKHQHNAMLHHNDNGGGGGQGTHHKLKAATGTGRDREAISTTTTTATTKSTVLLAEAGPTLSYDQEALLSADKNINTKQSHNTVTDTDTDMPENTAGNNTFSSTAASSLASPSPSLATTTTRKTLRKSTQRLLATPFHQLTYVRNEAGGIDIDSLDNISMYPDLMDNANANVDDELHRSGGTSRFTMISGYLPTSATSTLPESIRIAKIKINRERKRMLRLRNIGGYNA